MSVTFDEAVAALDARTNYETSGRLVSPTRERIEALLDMLGNPHHGMPAIHVTGTNGKTTTARAATEVLRASGLHVATYTSPHVESITERFSYDALPIPEDDFVDAWRELAPFLDHIDDTVGRVTWFEAATALAFLWFADKGVDAAVIEVGMGGEWDATNVIDAQVAAISRIDIDHAHVLGDTIEQIAREKAGIIKPGAVLCTVEQTPEAIAVLRARCEEVDAEIRAEPMAFAVEQTAVALGGQQLSIRLGKERYDEIFLPMFGAHFAHDATLGAAAARALLGDRELASDLIGEAFANTRVPGRMEVAHREPLVLLDGAHNPAAAAALAEAVPRFFDYDKLWLVVSVMDDKDVAGVLAPLVTLASNVILTRNASPRAARPEKLLTMVAGEVQRSIVSNVADAVSTAIGKAAPTDCVLVTGSIYTVGEARAHLAARRP